MKKTRLFSLICLAGYILIISKTVHAANITYDFSGTCQPGWDCGPVGVIDSAVGSVTGTLVLDLQEPAISQSWDKNNVLSYSFTFNNFTIDNTNSTLNNSFVGNIPFTTTLSSPFSFDDGFLFARYDADSNVFLNIGDGLNLVQNGIPGCASGGSCQTFTTGSWTRTSVIPVPAAVWLFGSGLIGLIGVARRKKA